MSDDVVFTNLLEETLEDLGRYTKIPEDVSWVQTTIWIHIPTESEPYNGRHQTYYCSWMEFANRAKDINYDAGYGTSMINMSLKIIGDNWWLERHEYDGSENWIFRTTPNIQGAIHNPDMRLQDYFFKSGTTEIDWERPE